MSPGASVHHRRGRRRVVGAVDVGVGVVVLLLLLMTMLVFGLFVVVGGVGVVDIGV